jgi:hypothetical protein
MMVELNKTELDSIVYLLAREIMDKPFNQLKNAKRIVEILERRAAEMASKGAA